jgi:anti-sigma B factor antagonist
MQIGQQQIGQVLVVTPEEERLDAAVAGAFKGFMVDAINQGRQKVVLNMANIEFVDSSGLTAIVSTLKSMGLAGGEMVVCGIGNNVAALFKLTRLDKVFRVFDDISQACQNLEK